MITIRDQRSPSAPTRSFELGPYGIFGPGSSAPGEVPRDTVEPPIGDLAPVASCVREKLAALPEKPIEVIVKVILTTDGVKTKVSPGTPRIRDLQACVDDVVKRYRRRDDRPGTIEVSVLMEYGGWCDVLPTGERPSSSEPIVVSGIKATRRFALHRTPFGFWLLSCEGPKAWKIRVDGGAVEVHATSGVVSRGRLTEHGLRIVDADGGEVLAGAGPVERIALSSPNEKWGELVSNDADGGRTAATLLMGEKAISIEGESGQWRVRGSSVWEANVSGEASPGALLILCHPDMDLVHRAELFALLDGVLRQGSW